MCNIKILPFPFPVGTFSMFEVDYSEPEIEDVDYIDITDIEDEDQGEEAYCVPI